MTNHDDTMVCIQTQAAYHRLESPEMDALRAEAIAADARRAALGPLPEPTPEMVAAREAYVAQLMRNLSAVEARDKSSGIAPWQRMQMVAAMHGEPELAQ